MKNPKRGPFDLSIDLEQIPGYKARFMTMDRVAPQINLELESVSTKPAQDQFTNLREKLQSGQDQRSLPSVILRRKGVRV